MAGLVASRALRRRKVVVVVVLVLGAIVIAGFGSGDCGLWKETVFSLSLLVLCWCQIESLWKKGGKVSQAIYICT
jgi:hypothetical protein